MRERASAALRFEEVGTAEVERLVAWLTADAWTFHATQRVDSLWVRERAARGYFNGKDARSFWLVAGEASQGAPFNTLVGLVRVFELEDVTPSLDLRIRASERGKGLGTAALRWITQYVYYGFPKVHRLGGFTRVDNFPMRRVFDKCGYVMEAYQRQAWRIEDAPATDAVGYAMLRSDWTTGATTRVRWPPDSTR
jgi:RimJ/RimL family protein N-acetyltransferase